MVDVKNPKATFPARAACLGSSPTQILASFLLCLQWRLPENFSSQGPEYSTTAASNIHQWASKTSQETGKRVTRQVLDANKDRIS